MRWFLLLSLLGTACSADFELPHQSSAPNFTVRVEPVGSLLSAPAVLRLRTEGAAGRSALADFHFFSGTLGAYHLGRIRRRDFPATLLEREVPLLTWAEAGDVVVAPLVALESGTYSLATPELGLVAEVGVVADLVPVVARSWPPPDATTAAGTAIFCGDGAGSVTPEPVELAPAGVEASVLLGLDENGAFPSCARVEPSGPVESGVPLLPPALSGGAAFEPRLLVVGAAMPRAVACVAPELEFGPACAVVADDRIEIHATVGGAFFALETPRPLLGAAVSGRSLVVRGFEPASATRVRGLAFDSFGVRIPIELDVVTSSTRPHVVLNEIFANPVGPEAKSEWIELVNDGSQTAELDGFVLDDSIEPEPLPKTSLLPGEFALLVAEGFAPDAELDPAPRPGTQLVVLPRLGRSGLANAGELLRLRDREGSVISRFPARAAPEPGRSVARRAPDAPDAEAASFGPHAAPGASPGSANVVDGSEG